MQVKGGGVCIPFGCSRTARCTCRLSPSRVTITTLNKLSASIAYRQAVPDGQGQRSIQIDGFRVACELRQDPRDQYVRTYIAEPEMRTRSSASRSAGPRQPYLARCQRLDGWTPPQERRGLCQAPDTTE